VDPSFEEIHSLDVNAQRVVTYRTRGGATVDFGIIVRPEKTLLPGVYIKRDLVNIYRASDIDLSVVGDNSIKSNAINFTSGADRADYTNSNPEIREGQIIKI
jgi:hypothetical protein